MYSAWLFGMESRMYVCSCLTRTPRGWWVFLVYKKKSALPAATLAREKWAGRRKSRWDIIGCKYIYHTQVRFSSTGDQIFQRHGGLVWFSCVNQSALQHIFQRVVSLYYIYACVSKVYVVKIYQKYFRSALCPSHQLAERPGFLEENLE